LTEILEALLNSGVLIPAIWISLGLFVVWLLLGATRVVPLTHEEAETLWKIHKQKTRCKAKKWAEVNSKNKLIGFECGCGHKHVQKKHIINLNSV
jgi:ABC-type nickel/cobalt efflux system permease component RcnA